MPGKPSHEYVFLDRCGCAIAMVVRRKPVLDEDSAWCQIFGRSRQANRDAVARGITCVLVDHDTYLRDYSESMRTGCTHRAVSADG